MSYIPGTLFSRGSDKQALGNQTRSSLRTVEIFEEQLRLATTELAPRSLPFLLAVCFLLHHSTTPLLRCRSFTNHAPSLLATNFSSFTTSAANFRIPSAVFSVAIALSFSR